MADRKAKLVGVYPTDADTPIVVPYHDNGDGTWSPIGYEGSSRAGEDLPNGVQKVEQRFASFRVTGDTLVKPGAGFLHAVVVSQPASATPTAGVFTIYNSLTEAGEVLFQHYFPASAVPTPVTIPLNCTFTLGCFAAYDGALAGLAFNFEAR